ncbi:uncharacterized protein si:dkeyp-50b9.1 isoform X2 [Triplophysa dalaica]|uniref:uncharacterized protein si:dkeyp-50b9.1 isoform X2 n=1 Tax=Triplophysa dalaica TaxID=1582913 RepID=UPI0024DFC1FF|nr:uncharacterized protein si:dkeyp-50b9.1 isoform X2 [Triplophysa dalaica]
MFLLVLKIKNEDVLRTVVTLLGTSLHDISPSDIHVTVHWPGINTLILTRDHAGVLAEYSEKRPKSKKRSLLPASCKTTEIANCIHNLGTDLYSDSEDEKEEESLEKSSSEDRAYRDGDIEDVESEWRVGNEDIEGWSWAQFQGGLQEFVEEVRNRRERRKLEGEEKEMAASAIGPESLIVAAACYDFKTLSTDTVLQLSLLAVRKRFRNLGLGSFIMMLLKHQSVVGKYDALVVHTSSNTVGFFKRHDLTDDIVLNEKFKELKEDWNNSILMSYLPPFTTDLEMRNPTYSPDFEKLEMDLDIVREQALSVYQQQMICVTRLIKEVKTLHSQLYQQREEVRRLNSKLENERRARRKIEHKFLLYKLKNAEQLLDNIVSDSDVPAIVNQEDSSPGEPEQGEQSDELSIQTTGGDGGVMQ